jgi:hypothetical protein
MARPLPLGGEIGPETRPVRYLPGRPVPLGGETSLETPPVPQPPARLLSLEWEKGLETTLVLQPLPGSAFPSCSDPTQKDHHLVSIDPES